MKTKLHGHPVISLSCLRVVAAIGLSLASGCGENATPTNTNSTSQNLSSSQPSNPVKAPTQSPEQATAALKKLNARFEQDPSLGGLFIDFGLILGNFPNEQLVHLQAIPKIVAIRLPEGVTDDGLAHLKGLSALKSLAILGNNLTDSGLLHLEGLTTLESVIIWSNKVTDPAVDRLKQALPKCQITLNR